MFFDVLLMGIMVGAIYTLVTIGYSMVYGLLRLMNFAHGDVYIFGTLACFTLIGQYNINPFIAILLAAIAGGILAALVEFLCYRRLRAKQHRLISMITALGAAYIIQNCSEFKWGNQVVLFPSIFPQKFITIFGLQISITQIITLFAAIAIIAVFNIFLKYHKMGKAILCVSEDMDTSRLMGIPINRVITTVYFLGGALGVFGGILYATSYNAVSIAMGFRGTIIAFAAAVLGGIGSMSGALIGGMFFGILENLISIYISSSYRDPILFTMFIFVLLIKPAGIMGSADQGKV